MHESNVHLLSFEPAALARCFLACDVLQACFGEASAEFAMIGLAAVEKPFHILASPLVCGQQVDSSSVLQSGGDVVRMQREIDELAATYGKRLVTSCWTHRHPTDCDASEVDRIFLQEVFANQVSSGFTLRSRRIIHPAEWPCRCFDGRGPRGADDDGALGTAVVEFGLGFGLIVNAAKEHSVTAVEKRYCPACGRAHTSLAPAALVQSPRRPLTEQEQLRICVELEHEIREKIVFCGSEPERED